MPVLEPRGRLVQSNAQDQAEVREEVAPTEGPAQLLAWSFSEISVARVAGDPPTIQNRSMEFGKAEMESNLLNGNY